MIAKINEAVLDTLKQYNNEFASININNNIVSYNNESIDLKTFNLDTLFESYQLKLDLNTLTAEKLFEIIKVNAITYLSNKGEEL